MAKKSQIRQRVAEGLEHLRQAEMIDDGEVAQVHLREALDMLGRVAYPSGSRGEGRTLREAVGRGDVGVRRATGLKGDGRPPEGVGILDWLSVPEDQR